MSKEVVQSMNNVLEYQLFMNGKWSRGSSGKWMDVINPANSEVVARVPSGTETDINNAVISARKAFDYGVWSGKSVEERVKVLSNIAARIISQGERLGFLETLTTGGIIRRTVLADGKEVGFRFLTAAKTLEQLPRVEHQMAPGFFPMHSYVKHEPVGVCALITPWNLPMMLGGIKIASALAMGNTIVVKPASITPVTTLELAKIIHEAGVPPGVINVVTGPGSTVGSYLAGHPEVDRVSFTGSTEVGRRISHQGADSVKRIGLELGGKSPLIILDDADMDVAVNISLLAFLFHTGQACESGTRLFVPRAMQQELVERMIAQIRKLKIGDPLSPETDIGPVVSEQQLKTIMEYVEIGKKEGAVLAYGGTRLTGPEYDRGFFFEPTIFTNCTNSMKQVREEIFGPVQCVIPYDSVEEAIAMANDSPYGLGGGICSRNVGLAQKIAGRLRTGSVWINTWHVLRPDMPFGGYKQSGLGRESSYQGLMEFTEVKHICQSLVYDSRTTALSRLIGLDK
jgi:acyl-CoA reductase-like NAD-dependent aldehyde dehydrogenase